MPAPTHRSNLKVLHILTLNGDNGEYGGPVRVAREICGELARRGNQTEIYSGALRGLEPSPSSNTVESYELVRPLTKLYKISSLWSWRFAAKLSKKLAASDIVHIHFARDLISYYALILCVLKQKPFVTQTHGMISFDGRIATRILDTFVTKPLLSKSKTNFVLTKKENSDLLKIGVTAPIQFLTNGIKISDIPSKQENSGCKKIVFCSRLHSRKGVQAFIQLAKEHHSSGNIFEIYGPDDGELAFILKQIEIEKLDEILTYKGPLKPKEVLKVLPQSDLLVLPSKNDPYPMIVVESLSVGTPVLVMPTCGIANVLKKFDNDFVAATDDFSGLNNSFKRLIEKEFGLAKRTKIMQFANEEFGIGPVCDQLEIKYQSLLQNK